MWKLFDYVNVQGENDILAWIETLQKPDRARLDSKFDMLEEHGTDLPAKLLTDTPNAKIKKIRVNGRVALRPLLCLGPVKNDEEFTLLKGAIEKDDDFVPRNAVEIADERRRGVIANPDARRCPHGEDTATKAAGTSI